MAELGFDMIEQILIRLDVEDLIQCKRVCKAWYSIVLDPCFVESHLNRSYENDVNTYCLSRRIIMPKRGSCRIVGSANGLVCVSLKDGRLLITNPCTREVKLLPPPLYFTRSSTSCWGFGYDLSIDDYKVIVGCTRNEKDHTRFYVFTLKSNVWRLIDRVKYMLYPRSGRSGILCDGALHWFMRSYRENERKVILSLDISSEEFNEIPLPDDHDLYIEENGHRLGCIRGCLQICKRKRAIKNRKLPKPTCIWEMWMYNEKDTWGVRHQLHGYTMEPDPVCYLETPWAGGGIIREVDPCLATNWGVYATAPVFMKSLVSPHIGGRRPGDETTDKRTSAIANSSHDDDDDDISGSSPSSLDKKRKWQPENYYAKDIW